MKRLVFQIEVQMNDDGSIQSRCEKIAMDRMTAVEIATLLGLAVVQMKKTSEVLIGGLPAPYDAAANAAYQHSQQLAAEMQLNASVGITQHERPT